MNLNKKTPIIIAATICMALIFSSCSTIKNELGLSDKAGITYNKLTESEKNLDADLKAIAKNKPLADLLKDSNSAEPLVKDGKVTATYRASWANIKMRTLSIREIRIKNKMKITKADEKKALTDAKSLFSGSDSAASDDIWKAFPKSFQDRLVESFAEQYALLRAAPEVTDKEIKKYYDENQSTIAAPCESGKVISHILVAEEADANDLKADIDGGADFAKLAKENSTDPGSKDKGGDLGCFTPGNFVAEFETAATNLAVGDVSEVVKTEFGYHILKATAYTTPKLEDVEDEIKAQLEPEKQQKLFDQIEKGLKKAKIKVSSKYGRVSFETDPSTGEKSEIPSIVPLKKDEPKESTTTTSAVPTS